MIGARPASRGAFMDGDSWRAAYSLGRAERCTDRSVRLDGRAAMFGMTRGPRRRVSGGEPLFLCLKCGMIAPALFTGAADPA